MKYILIGQKNVGKSSLFNRILGKKLNIVTHIKGSTRDWIEYSKIYNGKYIYLIDTPGLNPLSKEDYETKTLIHIKRIIKKNMIILFIVDYKNNINNIDIEILRIIRKFNLPIILIVNKVDNKKRESKIDHYSKFGLKNIFYISCSHNLGLNNLKKYLFSQANTDILSDLREKNTELSIGVYGKPNVGKSTFINKFLGFNRFQTANIPGLTTDSIYHSIKYKNTKIKILDTAGIKSQNKIRNNLEYISLEKSIHKISETKISILIIDCKSGIDRQDKRIINILSKKGKFLIIVFNKIDLINDKKKLKINLVDQLKSDIYQVKNLSYFFISSYKTNDVFKVINYACNEVVIESIISTSKINLWLKKTINEYSHPLINGKKINFKYATQVNSSPIKIKIYTNYSKKILTSYKRYLINSFIKYFNIKNQNIELYFFSSKNPYKKN